MNGSGTSPSWPFLAGLSRPKISDRSQNQLVIFSHSEPLQADVAHSTDGGFSITLHLSPVSLVIIAMIACLAVLAKIYCAVRKSVYEHSSLPRYTTYEAPPQPKIKKEYAPSDKDSAISSIA